MRAHLLTFTIVLVAACVGASSAEPESAAPVPLSEAVAEFNVKAASDPVGKEQSALTDDEVVAAVRLAELKDFPEAPGPLFLSFKRIAETRALPAGASFDLLTGVDPGGDFLFDVWYVRVMLPKEDGGTYSFTIRNRVIRCQAVGEVAAALERKLQDVPPVPGRYRLEERVNELKARAAAAAAKPRPNN